jgi:arylsulfatase A-like enzyme
MELRRVVLSLLLASVAAGASDEGTRAPERRNVLLLVSDDQRVDSIAALGNGECLTPNLDRLVEEGFALTQTYCMGAMTAAVCGPSRAMLMSGRQLFSFEEAHPGPPAEFPSLPAAFRAEGYETFATGKWHNGKAWFQAGFERGDSIFFGGMGSHTELMVHAYDPSGAYTKAQARRLSSFSSTEFAEAAITFLRERDRERPFFAYVAFTAPHDPRTPPEDVRARYDASALSLPENFAPQHPFDNGELKFRDERLAPWPRTPESIREHLADYYGMVSQLDDQVGRILNELEELGLADETLVVFTSDHGLAVGSHGLLGKQNLYEHSMAAPLVFRGPGIEPGRSDALAYLFDVPVTILDWAGCAGLEGASGRSLAPLLRREESSARDEIFTAYRRHQRALRGERFKLIRYPLVDRTQLFDLAKDPLELHDLSGDEDQRSRVATMLARLGELQRELGDLAPLSVEVPQPAEVDLGSED